MILKFFSSIQKFFKQIPKSNGRYKLEMVSDTKIVLSANEYNIGENQYDKINIYKIDKNQRLKIGNVVFVKSARKRRKFGNLNCLFLKKILMAPREMNINKRMLI